MLYDTDYWQCCIRMQYRSTLSTCTTGLAMFYAGLVRTRNVLSVFMHCFGIAALITILWTIFGYSLAFTANNPFIGGLSKSFLSGVTVDSLSGTIPELLFFVFQMTFAIITPGLFVGAFAIIIKRNSLHVSRLYTIYILGFYS